MNIVLMYVLISLQTKVHTRIERCIVSYTTEPPGGQSDLAAFLSAHVSQKPTESNFIVI